MTPEQIDIVNKLRMYAEDLHSARGFNGYATAMSLAADEIVRLRDFAAFAELVAAERDALKADAERYRWLRDRAWPFEFKGNSPEDADAAIDAARGV